MGFTMSKLFSLKNIQM